MRIGIQLPEVEREVRWREVVSIASAAEETGFESVWLGDHLLYRGDGRRERGPWDAFTTLAAIAAETERVRLGPLVACAAFHPPGILARMAASIDEVSGGRFVLGIGAGWNEAEFRAFGIAFDRRAARFEEAFDIVRRLLAGERVTFDGTFHTVEDAILLPPPARRVPLMLGSNGDRLLRAGLPHVDAWNTWFDDYGNTVEGFARLNARITDTASAVGRDPATISRSTCVLVEVDPAAGERPVRDDLRPVDVGALGEHLRGLEDAGADEAILVCSPITERSVREIGDVLGLAEAARDMASDRP